jgi:hypothetical protein
MRTANQLSGDDETTRSDCIFFHVIDLPDEEPTHAEWDFRKTEAEYHGHYPMAGKRVLEIGSATGSHAFWMEKQGANVTPYDLGPSDSWDLLPTFQQDASEVERVMRNGIRRLNNGWWYCRNRLGSNLTLQHGSIYVIPPELGDFDVITFGSVLLHTQNPVGAVQRAAPRAKDAIIITDRLPENLGPDKPLMEFYPRLELAKPHGAWTWWHSSPQIWVEFLRILGFQSFNVTVAKHLHIDRMIDLYTLVAKR